MSLTPEGTGSVKISTVKYSPPRVSEKRLRSDGGDGESWCYRGRLWGPLLGNLSSSASSALLCSVFFHREGLFSAVLLTAVQVNTCGIATL